MLTNYIVIQLNGKPFNCKYNLLLKDLLVYLNVSPYSNIIEYNDEIIQNSLLKEIILQSGDKVEIVTIVGGG